MMQIIPKWKVVATFRDREVALLVYDSHLSNVLRQVASLQFTENGLEQPSKVSVSLSEDAKVNIQSGILNQEPSGPGSRGR